MTQLADVELPLEYCLFHSGLGDISHGLQKLRWLRRADVRGLVTDCGTGVERDESANEAVEGKRVYLMVREEGRDKPIGTQSYGLDRGLCKFESDTWPHVRDILRL